MRCDLTSSKPLAAGVLASLIVSFAPAAIAAADEPPCGAYCAAAPTVTPTDSGYDGSRHVPGADAVSVSQGSSDGCANCQWAIVIACPGNGLNGQANVDANCTGSSAGCQPGQVRYRVYWRPDADSPWRVGGTECLGQRQPPAVADVGGAAQDFLDHMDLPLPQPTVQPYDGAVVNKEAIFSAGSGDPVTTTFDLGGLAVTVTATPVAWDWTFESGVTQRFAKPGGHYPNRDVTYVYRTPGDRQVTVTTTWSATFTVAGGAAQTVTGEVRRTSPPLLVHVREAPAELVSR